MTIPPNPVAIDATNVNNTSFQANWNAATSATSYKLDVSLNNSFSSFVTGYNNLTVNDTNQSVTNLTPGTQYYYRVRAVNASGESGNSNIIEVTMPVSSDDPNNVPVVTELIGCYPNPFNPSTTIKFSLDSPQHVMIQIFDISGRNVGNLVDDIRNKGTYTVSWNGTDNHGNSLASGVYLIQMKAGTYAVTRKVMMLK
jgi:predicted phage tail protein